MKQRCSTISPIPRNRAINPHQNSLNTTYESGNLTDGLRQTQQCGGVKQVNVVPTHPQCWF